MIETWSFRWAAEVFHEFSKQGCGLEAAQVRNEEAVNRHLRLSCLAQSMLQRAPAIASTSEQFAFAKGAITFGQRCRAITRFREPASSTSSFINVSRRCPAHPLSRLSTACPWLVTSRRRRWRRLTGQFRR